MEFVLPVPVVPLRGHRFSVEGSEGLEHVVEYDVAFHFFFGNVSRAESVGIPQVEVGLDEELVDLESHTASHNYLLHASVNPEGELVKEEQLRNYNQMVHPHQDSAAKACED